MKTPEAKTEAPKADILRDADEILSRELRKVLENYIAAKRRQLGDLRRLLH